MAAKSKTVFFCNECGYESAKWMGQCPGCRAWDSFVEEPVRKGVLGTARNSDFNSKGRIQLKEPKKLSQVTMETEERISTNIQELDRVLGGGIVIGSLVLVGGDPGIGKSTLLLQMCKNLVEGERKVLYISGEESLRQIKMRAARLGFSNGELFLVSETNLAMIEEIITKTLPEILIIDSIQTMYKEEISSAPGSVSQVRETTASFMHIAKEMSISIFIVGHVTKEGVVAGPRILEHMVDTVLYFEGENQASYRILRAAKNRFGSTNEIGVFEMRNNGLIEVSNPSEYMLQGRPEGEPGSIVACSMEGTRPILIEVQALVCRTNFNMPRRTAAGTDYNRINLLMAVIEKRLGISLSDCDAYVNVAGGMKINEPALDLAIIIVLISSYRNKALDSETIAFGEVGLTGEVRAISMAEQRVAEATKMGYKVCILPQSNREALSDKEIKLVGVKNLREVIQFI